MRIGYNEKYGIDYVVKQENAEMRCQILKIAICDDDIVFLDEVYKCVKNNMASFNISCEVEKYSSGIELLNNISRLSDYDMFFLDIVMDYKDGIQTALDIRQHNSGAEIIFITSEMDYIRHSVVTDPQIFFMKNSLSIDDMVYFSLKKIINRRFIGIATKDGSIIIDIAKVKWIENRGHYAMYHIDKSNSFEELIEERAKIDELENRYKNYNFVRIDRGVIVNASKIKSYSRREICLSDYTKLPVSRSRSHDVFEVLKNNVCR